MSTSNPESCGMGSGNCFDTIGGWTVGASGECFHDNIGFRLGRHGYKYGILQVWDRRTFTLSTALFSLQFNFRHFQLKPESCSEKTCGNNHNIYIYLD